MHIMKLECSGKLPIGMYAEMERLNTNLNEIDTKDCDKSLESLQEIAVKLYNNDPSKLAHSEDVQCAKANHGFGSHSDVSDNEEGGEIEVKEEPLDLHQSHPPSRNVNYAAPPQTIGSRQHEVSSKPYTQHSHHVQPNEQQTQHIFQNRENVGQGNTQRQVPQPTHLHVTQSVSLIPPPNQQIGLRHPNNLTLAHTTAPPPNVAAPTLHQRARHLPPTAATARPAAARRGVGTTPPPRSLPSAPTVCRCVTRRLTTARPSRAPLCSPQSSSAPRTARAAPGRAST